MKTEEAKYSEVLKTMRNDAKLKDLGADVHTIYRTRTGEMILELKTETDRKSPVYKRWRSTFWDLIQVFGF